MWWLSLCRVLTATARCHTVTLSRCHTSLFTPLWDCQVNIQYTELCALCTCLNSGQERKPSWSVSHLLKAASTRSSSTSRLSASSTAGLRPDAEARQHSRLCWGNKLGIICYTNLMDIFSIIKLTIHTRLRLARVVIDSHCWHSVCVSYHVSYNLNFVHVTKTYFL